jgi:polysaccharide pyruvyl transferase WcaK-like protein
MALQAQAIQTVETDTAGASSTQAAHHHPAEVQPVGNGAFAGLLHFYSLDNVGDAAIFAAFQRLAGQNCLPRVSSWNDKAADGFDALISVGGDIFNNGRPRLLTRRFIQKLSHMRWARERTMSFGQSIPPSCTGLSLRLLAWHMKRISSVTVRDVASAEKLRKLGVNAVLSVDSAFALTQADGDDAGARALYAEAGLRPENTVVFSIRNFNRMYPVDQPVFLARIAETMAHLKAKGCDVAVLIQADVNDDDSDRAIARQLQEEVDGLAILDPFKSGGTPWRVAFGIVDIAAQVIGTRYHTAVFRMAAGKMPIGLWYSNKGEDLNARFGVPGAHAGEFDPAEIADLAMQYKDIAFNAGALRKRATADFRSALAATAVAPALRDAA